MLQHKAAIVKKKKKKKNLTFDGLLYFTCISNNRTRDFEVNVILRTPQGAQNYLNCSQSRSLLWIHDPWFNRRNDISEHCLTDHFN